MVEALPFIPEAWMNNTERGVQIRQENLLNLNAALIVVFMVPVSILVAKLRTLTAMVYGMSIAVLGILVSGDFRSGWMFLLGVVFFSFGEMLTGPKKQEYLGLISPPGKKGLYLGYVNIPVGIGGGFGAPPGWLPIRPGEEKRRCSPSGISLSTPTFSGLGAGTETSRP